MFNIGVSLLNRISTMLGLKVLPDEAALQAYMRCAFKGIFFGVLGSVLLGSVIITCLYLAYNEMIYYGYNQLVAQTIVMIVALVLSYLSFIIADKWISQKMCVKHQAKGFIDEKVDYVKNMAIGVVTGFIEGLSNCTKKR